MFFNLDNKPKDWGLTFFRGRVEPFICEACNKPLKFRDAYLYSYPPEGTLILHNTKECWDKYAGTFS